MYVRRTEKKDEDLKIQSGIHAHFAGVKSLMLDGEKFTPDEVRRVFQKHIDAANATDKAKAAWRTAVKNERTAEKRASAMAEALESYVVATYGAASAVLSDFGFKPKTKKRRVSAETKAAAVQKGRVTRKAHETKRKAKKETNDASTTRP